MSAYPVRRSVFVRLRRPPPRALALAGAGLLSASYLGVLYHVVDVVGDVLPFAIVALGAFGLAVVLAKALSVRRAILLGALLLVGGLAMYLATVPKAYLNLARSLADTVALLTGLSVLQMTKVGIWAVGFTPGPVFVSLYFFLRREYVWGSLVGGATLAWFVSTGDAGTLVALAGVLGGIAAVGFGELDRRGGTRAQVGVVAAILVAILVVTTSVSVVPGGEARPLLADSDAATVEGSLTGTGDRIGILGSIRLSPEVRFTVTADEPARWRAGGYDRYTGGGWVRTGETSPYRRPLARPPGPSRSLVQRFRVESQTTTMPAAWKPVRVSEGLSSARVTDLGDLQPTGTLATDDEYVVESFVPLWTESRLRRAGTDYPDPIVERYTQLPESTPARVGELTDRVTAEAETPYDTAVAVERFLESEKGYSLDVNRPDGDIADAFLFEMDRGYCTYYATAMVTMLRTQGVPARFVVGYLAGEQVAEDEWVVRGYDSHAWVEVYFPGTGWVAFDPTPAGPREAAERARLEQARANGELNVDTNETAADAGSALAVTEPVITSTDATGGLSTDLDPAEGEVTAIPDGNETDAAATGGDPDGGDPIGEIPLPSREEAAYGVVLLVGAAVAGHRLGAFERLHRRLWLRRPITGSPRQRVTEAAARLEYVMGRRHRARFPTETSREYRDSLRGFGADDRALRLYDLYERARYADAVDEGDAREAVRLLREVLSGPPRTGRTIG